MCSVGILIGWTGPRGTFDQTLNKARWQVELFFGWIKQHLRVKSSFRTSENAVKSQIWIAVPVYVLVAIIKAAQPISLARNDTELELQPV